MRLIDADELYIPSEEMISKMIIGSAPTAEAISMSVIKELGKDLRIAQKGIVDKKVLLGFNMAVALCNKHIGNAIYQGFDIKEMSRK